MNASIHELLEQLGGPAWQASAPTHKLHAAFRDPTGKGVLALLKQKDAVFDLQRPLLIKGKLSLLLHAVVKASSKSSQAWREVIRLLAGRGVSLDQRWKGKSPLDVSAHSITTLALLLDLGAKVCSPTLLAEASDRSSSGGSSVQLWLDRTIVRVLELLPGLPVESDEAKAALDSCLTHGHAKATLRLLKMGVPVPSPKTLKMPAL